MIEERLIALIRFDFTILNDTIQWVNSLATIYSKPFIPLHAYRQMTFREKSSLSIHVKSIGVREELSSSYVHLMQFKDDF